MFSAFFLQGRGQEGTGNARAQSPVSYSTAELAPGIQPQVSTEPVGAPETRWDHPLPSQGPQLDCFLGVGHAQLKLGRPKHSTK